MKKLLATCFQALLYCTVIGQVSNITWNPAKAINTTINGNTLTKTASNGWNAGGSSSDILAANTDGYVEITVSSTNNHRFWGFSAKDESVNYTGIDFAFFLLSNASIRIYEKGAYRGSFGTYAIGDKLRVERSAGKIQYKKNGNVLYTSTANATSSLIVDATIYHQGGTVENAVTSFSSGGGTTTGSTTGGTTTGSTTGGTTTGSTTGSTTGGTTTGGTTTGSTTGGTTTGSTTGGTTTGGTTTGGTTTGSTSNLWTESANFINRNGKVVIGAPTTTTPGDYNLYVTKGILAERVRVALTSGNWADYVFAPDYSLNEIPYVASFIQKYHHLPNVPSAKEVAAQGIDVAEMNAILLRQIEELWLHTIKLNKRVEELEKELKKKN